MIRLSSAVALVFVLAPAAHAGRFVETSGSAGATVTITDDGCTASVLFDDARVRWPDEARTSLSLVLPLRIVGSSDVAVEARGFAAGGGAPAALLSTLTDDAYLFEPGDASDDNWSRALTLSDTRGRLRLVMAMDEDDSGAQSELAVDSIDLSIEDCGAGPE